ncbi:hypothetical protein QW060_25330 [Myroides ceti]|uniref:Uncharacterized protein n=1 Tax=Paenimyroides ceti TaxID=395087 RepID=A0ABT8D024_9FLAO|nr:hypothetical protein [Paenimyroides ceti]MDN3710195.1 hypothetical protein [Paenimyroides ceti]
MKACILIFEQRYYLTPLGNILYLVPPYCISTSDLRYIYQAYRRL